MKSLLFSILLFFVSFISQAQNGIIRGEVFNQLTNEPIPFANVVIQGTTTGVVTDINGKFEFTALTPGLFNLEVSYVGYKPKVIFEVEVTNSRPAIVKFPLTEDATQLEGVEVTAKGFERKMESPLSLRTIGTNEIKRNPGGNRDISKVVQSLPGVASSASFRNDILIRGGAPNENRFYLDGIEIPNINHFATQGASGGPVGIINVDFIREVEFYSGAFPANRGNALSSVFEFEQKDGRDDQLTFNGIVGASDLGVTLEGPLAENTTFILSARRSYLQFLFSVLGLPFLPTYNDYQAKVKHKFNNKNQLTFVSLGSLDDFSLNDKVLEDTTDENYRANKYTYDQIPIQNQWTYAIGSKFEHFHDNGVFTAVLSRNMLKNTSYKHLNNDESQPKTLDYLSTEAENKLRLEDYRKVNGWAINYGVGSEFARYTNRSSFLAYSAVADKTIPINYSSELDLVKWNVFGQVTKGFFDERLSLSLGFRADANNYTDGMSNLLEQLSPRFSASYALTQKVSVNFNTGIYYQLPSYTTLGYREEGNLVNQNDGLKYIKAEHLVGGLEYRIDDKNLRFTAEGFYKKYSNSPFSIRQQVALANLGADFGVIGDEPVTSTAKGRAYGFEFLAQQKFYNGFYGLLAYTWVRSEYTDANNQFVPSSWDNQNIVSLTAGKQLKRNWEIGARWLFSGGSPFTPYNVEASMKRDYWLENRVGIKDYENQLNTQRAGNFHQLDVRIDKKYFFDNWSLNFYLDIQNAYAFSQESQPALTALEDGNGELVRDPNDFGNDIPNPNNPNSTIPDPNNPGSFVPDFIPQTNGTLVPSIGVIIEF